MKCKFCDAELEEGVSLCPQCGGDNTPAAENPEPVVQKEKTPETITMTKGQLAQLIIGIVAAVALLAALAVVLIGGINFDWANAGKKEDKDTGLGITQTDDTDTDEDTFVPFDNGVSYTVTDKEALAAAGDVVATMGDRKLTNGGLRLYYFMQASDFINNNYYYLADMGLDYTKPLDQQQCYYDESLTWQQYFINKAIATWQNYQAVDLMAVEAGFEPDEELQTILDSLDKDMNEALKNQGYENADAWVQEMVGVGCTMAEYLDYCRVYYTGIAYMDVDPSLDELEAYFAENEAAFKDEGITKESGNMVDVRHILIYPEGGTTDANGLTTYTEEQWAAGLTQAEKLLQEWKSGEATEDSFAQLANAKSKDGGSNTNGGLYSGITAETKFVEPFLTWCMDENRVVGETGIVRTEYGYHIMYFSNSVPIWQYYAEVSFLSDLTNKTVAEGKEKYPLQSTLENVKLADISFV